MVEEPFSLLVIAGKSITLSLSVYDSAAVVVVVVCVVRHVASKHCVKSDDVDRTWLRWVSVVTFLEHVHCPEVTLCLY